MTKPAFKMPQRPTAAVDQWVTGDSTLPSKPPRASSEKPARLTIDLRPELHARFKAACALKGTQMVDEIRRFIEEWTQKGG
jgi:hypothetical protein